RECCGLLIGTSAAVVEVLPVRNIAERATRFLLDPAGHIAGRRRARERSLEIIGFYHSHPHSPAWPSETDVVDAAAYPDAVHLIVSLAKEEPETRIFRIEGRVITELSLTIVS